MIGVFLGISKVFDKAWREGILIKLKPYGVNGKMLTLLTNCLYERYQKVVRNGQTSSWELVQCGVPQGSVPSPLFFFLIYVIPPFSSRFLIKMSLVQLQIKD